MSVEAKISDFERAHQRDFTTALNEIKQGQKQTHWMWYIFPQIFGLSKNPSPTSERYAIYSKEEAEALLQHPVLGSNLREITSALLNLPSVDAKHIFGGIDTQKLKSSMTLFDALSPNDIYAQVLDKFFGGERDCFTLCCINLDKRVYSALRFIGVDDKDFNIVPSMYNVQRGRPTHRFSHIYRVMVGTALIAHKIDKPRWGLLAFIAAFIHDLARENDGDDPRHGRRAAETKLPKLTHLLAKYKITSQEYEMIAKAATYHCEVLHEQLSDECYKVCKILSDADALDRCRFDRHGRLDRSKLHFKESLSCIAPIDFLCKQSVRKGKIYNEIPFEEFVKVAQF